MKKIGALAGLFLLILALSGCGEKTPPVLVTGQQSFEKLATMSGCTAPAEEASTEEVNTFAKCLTDAGMTFYGAYWCPHCQAQKELFGESMQYINYVECDAGGENAQPEVCTEAGVEYYPSWALNK